MSISGRYGIIIRTIYNRYGDRINKLKETLLKDENLKGITVNQVEDFIELRVRLCASTWNSWLGKEKTLIEVYFPSKEDEKYEANYSSIRDKAKEYLSKKV